MEHGVHCIVNSIVPSQLTAACLKHELVAFEADAIYRVFHKKNIRFIFSSFLTQMLINSNEIYSKCAP